MNNLPHGPQFYMNPGLVPHEHMYGHLNHGPFDHQDQVGLPLRMTVEELLQYQRRL